MFDMEFFSHDSLALIFATLMGLAILIYVILDGYDLGVGILLNNATEKEKDKMISSIGPFWDANETWLVLAVGLLLVAFPVAHGKILSTLYIPATTMLVALIIRGVSFDFRSKAKAEHKTTWNKLFYIGSLSTALSQGYMLGKYVMGFDEGFGSHAFSILSAICLASSYAFIGSCWLIMKTEGSLQKKAINWARMSLVLASIGILMISLTTPLVSDRIFYKWFAFENFLMLLPLPILTSLVIVYIFIILGKMPFKKDKHCYLPFAGAVSIFLFCFVGLAYSFYPYVIPDDLTINEAAASTESLSAILIGVIVVLPCIVGYTIFAYTVFWGKAKDLDYY